MHVNDEVILRLDNDTDVFEGLIDTWEAQTSIPSPNSPSALNGLHAIIIHEIDTDGMIGIKLGNGVEFMCAPEELTLV